jgi:hypothetical protein
VAQAQLTKIQMMDIRMDRVSARLEEILHQMGQCIHSAVVCCFEIVLNVFLSPIEKLFVMWRVGNL